MLPRAKLVATVVIFAPSFARRNYNL